MTVKKEVPVAVRWEMMFQDNVNIEISEDTSNLTHPHPHTPDLESG